MSLLRRRQELPARDPHLDPRVEAVLQRVISLQAAIARKEQLAGQAMDEAAVAARKTRGGSGEYGEAELRTAEVLRATAAGLEREIAALHDEIEQRLAALGDDALFLAPVHARARARERGR